MANPKLEVLTAQNSQVIFIVSAGCFSPSSNALP
jgi:hypothetical protein